MPLSLQVVEEIEEQREDHSRYHHRRTTAHFSMPDLTRDTPAPTTPPPHTSTRPQLPTPDSNNPSSKKMIVRFSPSTAKLPPSSDDEEHRTTLSQRVERSSSSSYEDTSVKSHPSGNPKRNSAVLRSRSYGDRSELESSYRDHEDRCSTCSSSSSDEENPYELPPRRAYGGVRISYVSNDALAVARQRSGTLQSSGGKGLRRRRKHDDKNCIVS